MNDRDEIRTLLADLADAAPPMDIDVDRQLQRGRRLRRGHIFTVALTAVAASAAVIGGLAPLWPDSTPPEASAAGTTASSLPPIKPGSERIRSTEKSRALLAEFERLTPELAPLGEHAFDHQIGPRKLAAGADWTHSDGDRSTQVTVSVQVGVPRGDGKKGVPPSCRRSSGPPACLVDNGAQVPPVCESMTGPEHCTDIRQLADGSTAYLHEYDVPRGGHSYDVRLVRADKVEVYVGSGASIPPGDSHRAPLSLERVLEIAQAITVMP